MAGNRAVRPSGTMPTQLIPAPQTTATPRGSSTPARSIAKVSLRTSTVAPQSRASSAAASCSSSTGRSALARQADTCVTGPTGPEESSSACSTATPRASTAASMPTAGGWKPPPRAFDSTVPSAPISATSVLLFPASIARTEAFTPTPGAPGCARSACR